MIWHFLRYLVTFSYASFYKKIKGKNVHHLMVKGPVVIAMNHPNAFTDPVAVTFVSYPTRLKYLARGDAFKPGLVSFLLEWIGIVPIFRIQDAGKEGLKKNDEAFRRVNQLLKRNHKIIVFAEGLCIQERRLRPLKKGVARMVFGAHDFLKNNELIVVPVGVNYSKPDKLRSTLFYNVGEPIRMKDFNDDFLNNEARAYNKFLQVLEPRMKELITHINNKEYDETVPQIELLMKRKVFREEGWNERDLEKDHIFRERMTNMVNRAETENKALLDELKEKLNTYIRDVRKAGLRDWIIDPENRKKNTLQGRSLHWLLVILGMPLHLIGLAGNYPAYKLTETIVKKVIKANREFYSSMITGIGIVVFLFNYLFLFFTVYHFSPNVLWPLLSCFLFGIGARFSLDFQFFILKAIGLSHAARKPELVKELSYRREEIMSMINKF